MVNLQKNIPLSKFSNYKIGGPAKMFAEVGSVEELLELGELIPTFSRTLEQRVFILGGGTNLLISDEGFDGLVIHNKINGIQIQGSTLTVGSGVLVSDLLKFCIANSLSGLEWAGGLPGTVGGAVRGNAGAFKGETKDSVIKVQSSKLKVKSEITRNNEECQFGYRNSVFKLGEGKEEFITSVIFDLKPGDKEEIQKNISEKIDYRNLKHPMDFPNIGSTFKNIPLDVLSEEQRVEFASFVKTDPFPVVPTTKLLAIAGLKGKRIGGAMISDKHPNFIINVDNAKAEDVKALIKIAKDTILQKYGITLEEEIVYL